MRAEVGNTDPLISVSDLTVRFGEVATLDRVNLEVRSGEIVTVIGPNGAGKTTLLRAVLGLTPADTGRVSRRHKLRIGYMPQSIAIDDTLPLTVRRFLDLGGRVAKGRRAEVLDNVGVQRLLDQPLQRISGGEMQRVLLARALLRDPELLVLDEPAQGLDVAGQADLYDLIGQLRGELGCGVLMVSHDLHLVMAAADRVVCLNHHVCCTGAPHDVRENPEYLALFPETEIASLGIYTHHHDHAHGVAGDVVEAHDHAAHDHHEGTGRG
ncbi:MAG: zinc ABC transporter ATP-binding protein ZnuC [Proteobacteria bacterium]|nr:zinc ABC transporter ATP-binding protein ZnuC [Pseudomonadota bacterium]